MNEQSEAAPKIGGVDRAVYDRIVACIADSLAVPLAEIRTDSRLIDDLGADSLDFVDILFVLDRELDIRVRETEFNFLTRLDFSSPEVMKGAHLTEPVIAALETWLPALAAEPDRTQITPQRLFSMITVESIALVIGRRLALRAPTERSPAG